MPRSYEKNYTRKTLVEYINFLSLGVDPENPNFSITQLPKDTFLDWVKKVYAMLSEINRQEASPIKKEVVSYILEVLNNREKQFTHEDWA